MLTTLEAKIARVQQIRSKAKRQKNYMPILEYNTHLLYSQIYKKNRRVDYLLVDTVFPKVSNPLQNGVTLLLLDGMTLENKKQQNRM